MITIRFCHHCQQRTPHSDVHLPPGVIWVGNTRHEYDTDWYEIYCSRCQAHTMHHLPDDDPLTASEPHAYTATTTDEGS